MPFYDEPDEMSNAHVIEQQRQRILAPAIYGPSCQETLDALLAFDPVVRPDVHDAMLLPWWRRLTTTRKSLPEQKQDIFDRPMHPLPLLA
ncbi:hypothetical protein L596_029555 [Steinernema carpocapsae]|uniref:Protein kinase domain-containing protein n=1 Tax=Steinernema carpocapsae TaxID=34508 RepID=A0A4U5LUZ7_STECR|nr:hypothetical protein L596_029555 [Steinernema carpocapsae]